MLPADDNSKHLIGISTSRKRHAINYPRNILQTAKRETASYRWLWSASGKYQTRTNFVGEKEKMCYQAASEINEKLIVMWFIFGYQLAGGFTHCKNDLYAPATLIRIERNLIICSSP